MIDRILWAGAGLVALAVFVLTGFYGWTMILVWSALVLPLTYRRRKGETMRWPSKRALVLWSVAVVASVFTGLLPLVPIVGGVIGALVTMLYLPLSWLGVGLSIYVIGEATVEHSFRRPGAP